MSSMTDLTVFDGATTPTSNVLKAVSVSRDKGIVTAEWRANKANVPIYGQVRVTAKMQKSASGVYRTEARIVVPVLETVFPSTSTTAGYAAPPKVAYENTMIITGLFHERSDEGGRRLTRQLAANLLNNISTAVVPIQTGVLPELFDQLISPT